MLYIMKIVTDKIEHDALIKSQEKQYEMYTPYDNEMYFPYDNDLYMLPFNNIQLVNEPIYEIFINNTRQYI